MNTANVSEKLTWRSKISFGIGAFGKDMVYAIVSTFFMKYLTDIRLVDPVVVAILFAVARIWDAVNDTFMGVVVDNTRSKWGKFRPWILIGTLVNAVVLVLMYSDVNLSPVGYAAYSGVMYILWGMTYTIMDIPYWSMVPALTNDEKERSQISAIPRFFASMAWLVVGSFGLYIVKYFGGGNQLAGYARFAIAVAIIFVVCSLITVFNVKEKKVATVGSSEKISVKQMLRVLFKNDQVLVVLLIALFFNISYQLSNSFALYYFEYVCGVKEELFSVYTFVAGIAQMGALLLYPVLGLKINKKILFLLACIFPAVGFALLLLVGYVAPTNAVLVGLSSVVVNIGIGFMLVILTVILSEVVDYGEYKMGTRNESVIFSTQTFVVKLAGAFSALVSGIGLKIIGYKANEVQSAGTIAGMRIIMIVIPAILSLLCILVYFKGYKLSDKFYKGMLSELKERNAEADRQEAEKLETEQVQDVQTDADGNAEINRPDEDKEDKTDL